MCLDELVETAKKVQSTDLSFFYCYCFFSFPYFERRNFFAKMVSILESWVSG